jgi:uncharacterized protein YecT (DUF1311 family)
MIAALLLLLAQPAESAERSPGPVAVAEEPPEPDDDCSDPQDQHRMNFCASLDLGAADAALNQQWELTVAAMKAADAQVDRAYDQQPGYYETLLEEQRAWLMFRDAQCLLHSYEARGGSMQPMLELGCKASLTKQRTQDLRELVAGPER